MTKEESINQQYAQIRLLIEKKRLKEALVQLESFLLQYPNATLRFRLEQVQMSYSYMLQYMRQGVADPERKRLHLKLLSDTWEIADQARLAILDEVSERYYHKVRLAPRTENLKEYTLRTLSHILVGFNDDLAVSSLLSESKMDEALERHESTLKFMFLETWTNSAWTSQEEEEAKFMLKTEMLPINDLCLFVSAVTLSLMECFDRRKLLWLMAAYQYENVQVSQRALIGIVFTFHIHSKRIELYPEINKQLEMMNENNDMDTELGYVYQQLLLCQETDKIDRKMQEEIIPEMMKNVSFMRGMKLDFDESDEEGENKNPDWANAFEQSGLNDKLREMNELQLEGADVYMSTFAPMKNFPFFKEPHNWFYPFDKQHSSIIKILRDQKGKLGFLDLILDSSFFCNSDKYSLFFIMQQIPQSQRDIVLGQLTDQQAEDLAEQSKAETLKNLSDRPMTVSNQYLHDLYRFFKLSTRHHEFRNIFNEKIELHHIPGLDNLLFYDEFLIMLADFHLRKEHWGEAVNSYKELEEIGSFEGDESVVYQKLGFALQKNKKYTEAINAYLKADTIKPDSIWTNRHLATCYRMNREFDKALKYYRKVQEVAPEDSKVVLYICTCLAELNQYEEALNNFFKLDFMEYNCVKAWRGIGWCSFVCKKNEQAMRYYERVIEKKALPTDYLNAGHVAWVSGDIEKTIDLYRKSIDSLGSKDQFLEIFHKDEDYLISQEIIQDEIPLMLDLL